MHKIHAVTAVLAAVVAFTAADGLAAPAARAAGATAPAAPDAIDQVADPGQATVHCAVEIQPAAELAAAEAPVCFTTKGDVTRYLDAVTASERSRVDASGLAVASSVAVGTVYSNSNGGGSSLTFWGSSGCAGVTFGFASLPSNWSSIVSSGGGSNGCWATMYASTGYAGSRINCTPWCGGLGALNDRVRSIVFRPTGTWG